MTSSSISSARCSYKWDFWSKDRLHQLRFHSFQSTISLFRLLSQRILFGSQSMTINFGTSKWGNRNWSSSLCAHPKSSFDDQSVESFWKTNLISGFGTVKKPKGKSKCGNYLGNFCWKSNFGDLWKLIADNRLGNASGNAVFDLLL